MAALRKRPGSTRHVEAAAPIPELFVSYARVPEEAPVSFRGDVTSTSGGVIVRGVVEAPYVGECRRCLEEASGTMIVQVDEVCLDHPDPELGYGVGSEWLDLEPMVHDACILELPLAPLCREDCQGLCPVCGVNRNSQTCSCVIEDIDDQHG